MLQVLAFAEPPIFWLLAKACAEGMVGALIAFDVDPFYFLDRANLAPRYLRRCGLARDFEVSADVCSGPHGEEVAYLLSGASLLLRAPGVGGHGSSSFAWAAVGGGCFPGSSVEDRLVQEC